MVLRVCTDELAHTVRNYARHSTLSTFGRVPGGSPHTASLAPTTTIVSHLLYITLDGHKYLTFPEDRNRIFVALPSNLSQRNYCSQTRASRSASECFWNAELGGYYSFHCQGDSSMEKIMLQRYKPALSLLIKKPTGSNELLNLCFFLCSDGRVNIWR